MGIRLTPVERFVRVGGTGPPRGSASATCRPTWPSCRESSRTSSRPSAKPIPGRCRCSTSPILAHPHWGDPILPLEDEVPVFWACGVTPQALIMAARPEFAITHAPGHMFITDVRDEAITGRQPALEALIP